MGSGDPCHKTLDGASVPWCVASPIGDNEGYFEL